MDTLGQVAGMVNPLLGMGVSLLAGHEAQQGAREQQATSAQMAKEQMDFQERMSNTSWQRAVKDIKAAGLNPALAYSQGGASAPMGAMGQAQNVRGAGVSSAVSAAQTVAQLASTRADIGVARSQAALNGAAAAKALQDAGETQMRTRLLYGVGTKGTEDEVPWQKRMNELMLQNLRAQMGLTSSQTRETTARATLQELDEPMARNRAKAAGSAVGRFMPYIDFFGNSARAVSPFIPR